MHDVSQKLMTVPDDLYWDVGHLCCPFEDEGQGSEENLKDDETEQHHPHHCMRVENPPLFWGLIEAIGDEDLEDEDAAVEEDDPPEHHVSNGSDSVMLTSCQHDGHIEQNNPDHTGSVLMKINFVIAWKAHLLFNKRCFY